MPRFFPLLISVLLATPGAAGEPLFDRDPDHIGNRLHRHLQTRVAPNGEAIAVDGLEPAFVPRSKFLTDGPSHERALLLLDEFLAAAPIDDPLQRAVLQRDLWAIFLTTADPTLPRQPQRRELQLRLAQAMRRIALSADEIEQLPDNLAATAAAGEFAAAYDSQDSTRPFLPRDLMQPDGPWVLVRSRLRRDGLAAPSHVRATEGRSTFFLFLNLPEGRRATVEYLNRLKDLPVGTEIPQIPVGTQVALLRQMTLVDDAGVLRPTRLTESLQIRVYRDLAAPDMYEFSLHRADLVSGRAGGLLPTGRDETNYFGLGFLGFNPGTRRDPLEGEFPPTDFPRTATVMKSCVECHAGPGIFGFQSMFVDHFDTPPLDFGDVEGQASPVIDRTYQSYNWGLLQGLWVSRPLAE